MLAIKDLTKTYSSGVHALQAVSLDVPAGMFGLLGPNDLDGSIWEATVPHEKLAPLKTRCQVLSAQMVGGLVRLRVISRNGRPSEEFDPASAVLDDYYFNLVNEKRAS